MSGAIQTAKKQCFGKVQNKLKCVFISTFMWGLIAHAYGMLHSSFLHDGLNAIYIDETEEQWKVAVGRVFVNVFRSYRGKWELPWLIGIVSLLFITISVYLLTGIFSIDSIAEIVTVSGIMVFNPTVRNLVATFIYEMDIDMFGLLVAVAAVFFLTRKGKLWICGIPCITISLGLYQAYLSVAVTLATIYIIDRIINDTRWDECWLLVKRTFLQVVCGGVAYYVVLKLVSLINGIDGMKTGSYNGLNILQNNILFSDSNFALE